MNIVANLYVSNGMSAGNTRNEARVQGLSEVFERYVKNRIIAERISLPAIPEEVLARYPQVTESIRTLESEGFPIFCFDASLGGQYPVICVVLFNPPTVPVLPLSALILISVLHWSGLSLSCYRDAA